MLSSEAHSLVALSLAELNLVAPVLHQVVAEVSPTEWLQQGARRLGLPLHHSNKQNLSLLLEESQHLNLQQVGSSSVRLHNLELLAVELACLVVAQLLSEQVVSELVQL